MKKTNISDASFSGAIKIFSMITVGLLAFVILSEVVWSYYNVMSTSKAEMILYGLIAIYGFSVLLIGKMIVEKNMLTLKPYYDSIAGVGLIAVTMIFLLGQCIQGWFMFGRFLYHYLS